MENEEEEFDVDDKLVELLADKDLEEITRAGQAFFKTKVSELLMKKKVRKAMDFDKASWDKEQYMTGLGLDMVSMHISKEERKSMKLNEANKQKFVDRMNKHGVVVLRSVIDKDLCQEVARASHRDVLDPDYPFGNIQEDELRKDYPLKLSLPYTKALEKIIDLIGPSMSMILGENAKLAEFSAMTTYPQAPEQEAHSDSGMDKPQDLNELGKLFSCYLYLDEVEEDRGALDFWPATHTHYHFIPEEEDEIMTSVPAVRVAVPMGSIVIYDSRIFHRGSGNTSKFGYTRPTMYFSLLQNGLEKPDGSTYSVREIYSDVTIENILARDYSSVKSSTNETEKYSRHNDKDCEKGLKVFECIQKEPEKCASCGYKNIEEKDFGNCTIGGRIEKICKFGIFSPEFQAKVSWGIL